MPYSWPWHLYITGKNNWHGLLNLAYTIDDYFHTGFDLIPNSSVVQRMSVNVSPTQFYKIDGVEKADECFVNYLKKSNCSKVCLPILFNFLSESLPFCAKNENYICMLDYFRKTGMAELPCYYENQKIITKYRGEYSVTEFSDVSYVEYPRIWITMKQSGLTVFEERYIMTTADFIGSVGGSLGLFLGFSFFTYASDALDKVFDRIDRMIK